MAKLDSDFPSAEHLINAGFTTLAKVQKASDEDLLAVEHIGPAALEKIRAASQEPPAEASAQTVDEPPVAEIAAEQPASYACPAPLCGQTITSSPCPYCGR